jgi:nucleotide-binding universal stress UspA family protein
MTDIQTVLCPVDLSPLSERALQVAIAVCQRFGARLVLEHNLDSLPPGLLGVSWMYSQEQNAGERDQVRRADEALRRLLSEIPPALAPEAKVTQGPVAEAVLHLARELPAELLVMGTHGPSNPEHHSLTEDIVRQAPCAVLTLTEEVDTKAVVRGLAGETAAPGSLLLPVDLSARSRAALDWALALLDQIPLRLTLLHVVAERAADREMASHKEKLQALVPPELADRVSVVLRAGDAAAEILEVAKAERPLLVLMVGHGRGLLRRLLLGSTTIGVLGRCACPVLFLPPRQVAE